jgi:F-type H+-transporting ATPase subunit a
MSQGHGINFVGRLLDTVALQDFEPIMTATLVAGGVVLLAISARRQLVQAASLGEEARLIPRSDFSPRMVFEGLVEFVVGMSDTVMGKDKRRYIPFCCTLFIFLLALNLFGLIPGFSASTDDLPINFGLALVAFVMYHAAGVKNTGLGHYVAHFFGPQFPGKPALWVLPFILLFRLFMFGIELISHFVRPVTLSLRLYGNMLADHTVLMSFMAMVGQYFIPVIFYLLGAFICLVQASVFTLLTMVYIKLAVGEEGAHEH